jgi:hypothetical protein
MQYIGSSNQRRTVLNYHWALCSTALMPFSPAQRATAGFMFGMHHFPIGRNQFFIQS